jgi:hypothetical protein
VLLGGAPARLGKATAANPTRLKELQRLGHDANRHKGGERAKNTDGVG